MAQLLQALRNLVGETVWKRLGQFFVAAGALSTVDWIVDRFRWLAIAPSWVWILAGLALWLWSGRRHDRSMRKRVEILESKTGHEVQTSPKKFRTAVEPSSGDKVVVPEAAKLTLTGHPPEVKMTQAPGPGPEFYCYVGRTLPAITADDLSKNRFGVHLFVFNGNPVPVMLKVLSKKLAIRDPVLWIPDFVEIEISQERLAPGKDTLVSIYVRMVGPGEETLRSRLKEDALGDFVLGDIDIRVIAGDREGRLRLPDGLKFTKKEQWALSWIAYMSGAA